MATAGKLGDMPTDVPHDLPAAEDAATRCRTCGFLDAEWRGRDLAAVLNGLGRWWALATAPGPVPPALARGDAAVAGLEAALGALGATVSFAGPEVPVQRLGELGRALGSVVSGAPDDHRPPARVVGGRAVHDLVHLCTEAARAQAAAGTGAPSARGTVAGIHVSGGGVPKHPVPATTVGWRGVAGDRQADAAHHGRPFQAVCLWSADVIAALAADGHPIGPGAAGENLTLFGVEWAGLRPGTRIVAGSTELELSYPAVPCGAQARWFADGDFRRIAHERHPGRARWYAWVRRPGAVAAGDAALVEP